VYERERDLVAAGRERRTRDLPPPEKHTPCKATDTFLARSECEVLADTPLHMHCSLSRPRQKERICIELMTSDRNLKASREGSK